jgi:hypothetical protein
VLNIFNVCSLGYPACNARAPYFIVHLWPVRLYYIFFTLPHKRYDFRKNVTEHKMCVLIFCTNKSEIFLFPGRIEGDIINVHRSSSKVIFINVRMLKELDSGFGGLGVSALTFGTQVRGFKPGRSRRIFHGEKILSTPSFGMAVKPWVQCH